MTRKRRKLAGEKKRADAREKETRKLDQLRQKQIEDQYEILEKKGQRPKKKLKTSPEPTRLAAKMVCLDATKHVLSGLCQKLRLPFKGSRAALMARLARYFLEIPLSIEAVKKDFKKLDQGIPWWDNATRERALVCAKLEVGNDVESIAEEVVRQGSYSVSLALDAFSTMVLQKKCGNAEPGAHKVQLISHILCEYNEALANDKDKEGRMGGLTPGVTVDAGVGLTPGVTVDAGVGVGAVVVGVGVATEEPQGTVVEG
eukprot:g56372.t1